MDFEKINVNYMKEYGKLYGIVDIKDFNFLPTIKNVLICFIVNTEKEKELFLNNSYNKCCEDYLKFSINQNSECESFKYEFMVLSKEEVKKKYRGNYYYAMH